VAPEDYEAVRTEIIEQLSTAVCATTGRPLVRRVLRREEAYSGPYVERSPDLIVEWVDEGACLDIRYPDGTSYSLLKKHLPDDPYDLLLNRVSSAKHWRMLRSPTSRPRFSTSAMPLYPRTSTAKCSLQPSLRS
jgi:hypothetical protein